MKILVVDDYEDIVELVGFYIDSFFPAEIITASSGNQAIEVLKKESYKFDLIISDIKMSDGTGLDLADHLHNFQITIPILLMSGDTRLLDLPQLQNRETLTHIEKPFSEEELKEAIEKSLSKKIVIIEQREFVPVHIALLRKIEKIEVPLYIKINDQKYVKLTQESSFFGDQELKKYQERVLTHLYFESFLGDLLIKDFRKKVLSNESWTDTSVEDSIELISFNTEVLRSLSHQMGFNEKFTKLVIENTQKTLSIAKKNPKMNSIIKQFQKIERLGHADHCTLLTLLTSGLAEQMQMNDELTIRKLTFASLFHDICLTDQEFSKKGKIVKELIQKEKVSKEQKDVFKHPAQAAELCKSWDHCPQDVDKIISNHHEQPNGSGFPIGKKAQDLDILTAIFIISEDFVHYYIEHLGKLDAKSFAQSHQHYSQEEPFKTILSFFSED